MCHFRIGQWVGAFVEFGNSRGAQYPSGDRVGKKFQLLCPDNATFKGLDESGIRTAQKIAFRLLGGNGLHMKKFVFCR